MPSFGIHFIVLDELRQKLLQSTDRDERQCGILLSSYPEIASLGAIGPDLFYYLGFKPGAIGFLTEIYQGINFIPSLFATIGENRSEILRNSRYLLQDIAKTTLDSFKLIEASLTTSIVGLHNLIAGEGLFGISEQQEGKTEKEWNWGDLLHDRQSGAFAKYISDAAKTSNNPFWKAYSLGYKSHLITDFAGHPYVNQVVGGPARAWNMRHTLAEKFMDQSMYVKRGADINQSNIDSRMRGMQFTRVSYELFKMLEIQFNNLIVDSVGLPYTFPDPPSNSEIAQAFNSMLDLFNLTTSIQYIAPPMAPQMSWPNIPEQYRAIDEFANRIFPSAGRGFNLSAILKYLLEFIAMVGALLTDLIDIIVGVLAYPIEILLYLYETIIYSLYREIQYYLVLAGVAFPYPDDLNSPLGRQFIKTPGRDDIYPHMPPKVSKYIERFIDNIGHIYDINTSTEQFYHYPNAGGEYPQTSPSVYPAGVDADFFINELQFDPEFFKKWKTIVNPADLRNITRPPDPGQPGGFGNAVDLSKYYITGNFYTIVDNSFQIKEDDFLNINLDSDRGYAYKQWHCDGDIPLGIIHNERYF